MEYKSTSDVAGKCDISRKGVTVFCESDFLNRFN